MDAAGGVGVQIPPTKVRCHRCGSANVVFEESSSRPDGSEVQTYRCQVKRCGRRTAIVKPKEVA